MLKRSLSQPFPKIKQPECARALTQGFRHLRASACITRHSAYPVPKMSGIPSRLERRRGLIRGASQEERIFGLLKYRGASWTPAHDLAAISLQYCRTIAGLRRRGLAIENRVEIHDGKHHGFYRLALKALVVAAQPTPAKSGSLFGDVSPERYPD